MSRIGIVKMEMHNHGIRIILWVLIFDIIIMMICCTEVVRNGMNYGAITIVLCIDNVVIFEKCMCQYY